jgi:hypothetical protein
MNDPFQGPHTMIKVTMQRLWDIYTYMALFQVVAKGKWTLRSDEPYL